MSFEIFTATEWRDESERRNRVLKEATDEMTHAEREYARKGNKASEPFTGWDDDE